MSPAALPPARVPTGSSGLDGVLHGGVLRDRTTLLYGGPGTGKTVLGLQFLCSGVRDGEPGLLVSFEESPDELLANAATFRWFPADASLQPAIVDGRLPEDTIATGGFDVNALLAVLGDQIRRLGVKRVVLDAMDALFALHGRQRSGDAELLRVLRWLDSAHVTALLTLKPGGGAATPLPYELAEYLAGTVVRLETQDLGRFAHRTVSVVKLRGGTFAEGRHPYRLSEDGLTVAYTSAQKVVPALSGQRRSTGIARLDRMIGGGIRCGTVTLVSGLPGTAKTTLSGNFLAAGLEAGDPALLVSFDEPASQSVFDLRSVGLRLDRHDGKLLRTASFNASAAIADEHYLTIERLVDEHRPKLLAVDPISALVKAGGPEVAALACERIVELAKSRGITAFFTAVSGNEPGDSEMTQTQISTIADTWIHLSYSAHEGERNRTLTVIKSRGAGNSNQMRELLLDDDGVTLKDVYLADGAVLLGTARAEYEARFAARQEARESELRQRLEELDRERAATEAQLGALRETAEREHERRLETRWADPVEGPVTEDATR